MNLSIIAEYTTIAYIVGFIIIIIAFIIDHNQILSNKKHFIDFFEAIVFAITWPILVIVGIIAISAIIIEELCFTIKHKIVKK